MDAAGVLDQFLTTFSTSTASEVHQDPGFLLDSNLSTLSFGTVYNCLALRV